jgi:hypothetical protein
MTKLTRICVNGSRSFNDYKKLEIKLNSLTAKLNGNFTFNLGAAKGADTLAQQYAEYYHIPYILFPALWDLEGKAAGILRNKRMLNESDVLISFWDYNSPGTKHAIEYAKHIGIGVCVIKI